MRKFLGGFIVVALVVLFAITVAFSGAPTGECNKTCKLTDGVQVTIPEKAPDFHKFAHTQIIGSVEYKNGNGVMVAEALNADLTVGVIVLFVRIEQKIHIVAMQVNYAPEGFDKFDATKDHLVDKYEDTSFTKSGVPSGYLSRVKDLTDFGKFKFYIDGVKI